MNILDKILETKRSEIALLDKKMLFLNASQIERNTLSFRSALENSKGAIISEFKRHSPSKGYINRDADVSKISKGYAENGAAALSILTDASYFKGSSEDLIKARALVNIPILRKDFIIDETQICEARIWGADVILLIASALTPKETERLALFSHSLNLEVLLEIHNKEELGHINEHIDVVGVNNRNLTNFQTDATTSIELAPLIPSQFLKISESGISNPQTVKELCKVGYKGFLMGENFMKSSEPEIALSQFISEL